MGFQEPGCAERYGLQQQRHHGAADLARRDEPPPAGGGFACPGARELRQPRLSGLDAARIARQRSAGCHFQADLERTAGAASGVPQRIDFLHGRDPQAMVRAALADAVAELSAHHGPDMARWTTPVVRHRFANTNAIGVPWAGADEQPETTPYVNQGTLSYRVVLRPGAVEMCSVAAPGQSGFVDPTGRKDRHYGDQLALFQGFGCKPEHLTPAQLDANLESTRVLRY